MEAFPSTFCLGGARAANLLRYPPSVIVASRRSYPTPHFKRNSRSSRPLIKVSTANGKWRDSWKTEQSLSLQELQLGDLIEDDEQKDAEVRVVMRVQKHAGFGFSIDGTVGTSFVRKCRSCLSPFCREINSNINVLLLPSTQEEHDVHLPEIGGDDSSVIYVKPGSEVSLDSLVQEAVRLSASVMVRFSVSDFGLVNVMQCYVLLKIQDTCSEQCQTSEPTIQYATENKSKSIDTRWSVLLDLKRANSSQRGDAASA